MKRLANFIIDNRLAVLSVLILMTIFFLYEAVTNLTVKTVFSDLLPQNHEYVKLHNEIRSTFGGGNQVYIMVQVRGREDGGKYDDVFNSETLNIIRSITRDLLKFNAVDRYKIMSLASDKVKNIEMTSGGMSVKSMMWPEVPKTEKEIKDLRSIVYGSPMAYPGLVSMDSKKALITVDFFEEQLDYRTSFKELKALREKYEDKNHIIGIC
jgi:predicted RND superfamily exporter protein